MTCTPTSRIMGQILCITAALFVLMGIPDPAHAQESDELLTSIRSAFMKNNATDLAGHFPSSVEIALFGSARFYSRGQATLLLRNHFKEYPTEGFKINDFTKTTNGWFIEALVTVQKSEQEILVYLRLRRDRTGWKIRELVFEEPDE